MKKNKLNLLVLAGMLGMLQSQAMAAPVENNSTKTQETKKDCEVPSIFVIDQRGESRLTSDVKLLTYVDEEGNYKNLYFYQYKDNQYRSVTDSKFEFVIENNDYAFSYQALLEKNAVSLDSYFVATSIGHTSLIYSDILEEENQLNDTYNKKFAQSLNRK